MTMSIASGRTTIIDDEDYATLSGMSWHVNTNGYVVWRGLKDGVKRTIRMHRLLTNAPEGMDVDHINGERTDNRKSNLRIVTRSQNLLNKVCDGTWLDKRRGTWQVEVRVEKKKYYFGAYKDKGEAMHVYAEVKSQLLGGRISRRTGIKNKKETS
jgi:hypothetical protein